jgi:hypothetical protein
MTMTNRSGTFDWRTRRALGRLLIAAGLALVPGACDGSGRSSIPTAPTSDPANPASPTGPASPTSPASPATYTVSGVVFEVTAAGHTPVTGARVQIISPTTQLETTTDGDGLYTVSGVPAGPEVVRVSNQGYERRKTVTIGGDTRIDIEVFLQGPSTLSGVMVEVTPTGRVPVQGVELECDTRGDGVSTVVHTDANGFYEFAAVLDGTHELWMSKEGFLDPAGQRGDFTWTWRLVTVSGDTRLDIELVRR